MRFVTDVDQYLTHKLAVYDEGGAKLIEVVRPRKIFKSRFEVRDGTGREVGKIVQNNVFGKITFDLLGEKLGAIKAENWRAWDFSIVDAALAVDTALKQDARGFSVTDILDT